MSKEFVDTNVLLYAFDREAGAKRWIALQLVDRLWREGKGCVSLQVLEEFYVTAARKLKMKPSYALRQVRRLGKWTMDRPSLEDVLAAIEIHRRCRISYWDALIVRSAAKQGCSVIWSEDLSSGQWFGRLRILNPFRETAQ